ncbi:MAG: dihydroorotate dehydrogenase electron transfer subunit [Proteobacteria bacterium]|nr:dihydroorotate dehydrogenase electron transfer subunit [Pseudomonadota bacterium]
MSGGGKAQRGTIFVEDAAVLAQDEYPGQQYVIRLHAPLCAAQAKPGSFTHVCCDPAVPMRRPLSIMRASADGGWIELLYKVIGDGLRHLSSRQRGDSVSIIGPIGNSFVAGPGKSRPLLIGGGVGIPPIVFLAESLAADHGAAKQPLVLMGSELPFPFQTVASALPVPGAGREVTHGMPLMEALGIASRLASGSDFSGCYPGFVTELARDCLRAMSDRELAEVEIFACGPEPMLAAVAGLARELDLPCQISLEEFMACAVGGCAGCTVEVQTAAGVAMQRVCVDGPVFDARTIYAG